MNKHFLIIYAVVFILASLICLFIYLFSPNPMPSVPDFDCVGISADDGILKPLNLNPRHIYGIGLSYSSHIQETASNFNINVPPPIFIKNIRTINQSEEPIKIPSFEDMSKIFELIEPGLSKKIGRKLDGKELPALLDYEVELAFVLLDDITWDKIEDPSYIVKVGFFIANDISARGVQILGEGMPDQFEYWGLAKSFTHFLPVGKYMWVPHIFKPNTLLCTTISSKINGEVRQEQLTSDQIYTPRKLISYIAHKYPNDLPQKGDVVLMGTPGGVALQTPAWKARLANLLHLGRFIKLATIITSSEKNGRYLKPGDEVIVSGGILGSVKTKIVASPEQK